MKCFDYHLKNRTPCKKEKCRYWIKEKQCQSCGILLARNKDSITLEEIGNIFGVTRMRICQIEKKALKKIKSILTNKNYIQK